MEVALAS